MKNNFGKRNPEVNSKDIKIELKILPHMRDIFEESTRIKVIVKGRRSGATMNSILYLIECCLKEKGKRYLWCDTHLSMIFSYYDKFFYPILKQLPPDLYVFWRKRVVLEINENIIFFKSAENVASIEGDSFHKIFVNEAGFLLKSKELYNNSLLPMITDTQGQIIINGTPRGGKGTFYEELYYEACKLNNNQMKGYKVYPHQNPYIPKHELKLMYERMKKNPNDLKQEFLGEFVSHAGYQFYYNFNRDRHVSDIAVYDSKQPIYVSFDFNIDQQATLIFQINDKDEWYCIDEIINKGGDIQESCDIIKNRYNVHLIRYVYGDVSGGHRTGLMKNVTYWTLIQHHLGLNEVQIKLPTVNPRILDSRENINWFLKTKRFIINPKCSRLINDLEMVQSDQNGFILKNNPDLTHFSDALRYIVYYRTSDELYVGLNNKKKLPGMINI